MVLDGTPTRTMSDIRLYLVEHEKSRKEAAQIAVKTAERTSPRMAAFREISRG